MTFALLRFLAAFLSSFRFPFLFFLSTLLSSFSHHLPLPHRLCRRYERSKKRAASPWGNSISPLNSRYCFRSSSQQHLLFLLPPPRSLLQSFKNDGETRHPSFPEENEHKWRGWNGSFGTDDLVRKVGGKESWWGRNESWFSGGDTFRTRLARISGMFQRPETEKLLGRHYPISDFFTKLQLFFPWISLFKRLWKWWNTFWNFRAQVLKCELFRSFFWLSGLQRY